MASQTIKGISLKVQESLKDTPFASSNLEKLSGGTANFVYRGILERKLEDGSKTVVIKHTEGFAASNFEFKLDEARCDYERTILTALHSFPVVLHSGISIQTPRLYHFSASTNTQIYTDLPSSLDLKTFVLTHASSLTRSQCLRLGQALGKWFGIIERFPDILEEKRYVLEGVRESVKKELEERDGELIHGDFWSGNVLLPSGPIPSPETTLKVFIIDWEMSQLSLPAFDLGQMVAELYELKHFKGHDAGIWLIEGFLNGYGKMSEEMKWKTIIHAGTHMVCWGTRVAGWGTEEQAEDVVRVGRDWIVGAWEKNRGVFEGTVLEILLSCDRERN